MKTTIIMFFCDKCVFDINNIFEQEIFPLSKLSNGITESVDCTIWQGKTMVPYILVLHFYSALIGRAKVKGKIMDIFLKLFFFFFIGSWYGTMSGS